MAVDGAPWRRERPKHFFGMPAWSMPADGYQDERIPASLFREVEPGWAWEGADGDGVRVCVLDSGVDASHPLVGSVDRAWQVVTAEGRAPRVEESEPRDSSGHGTACAGII